MISAAPSLSLAEFTLSVTTLERIRNDLPESCRQHRFLTPSTFAVLLERAFSHLHNNIPIFHRPTMQLGTFPMYLILAIASLGALLSDETEAQQFGLALHSYVRDLIFNVPPHRHD
jgi:hypothetical protein